MKRALSSVISFLIVPVIVAVISILFPERSYLALSLGIALISILFLFFAFDRKQMSAARLVIISSLTALSIVGRILFAPFPGVKPVTAFVILTAIWFGPESGYLCGALSALISNFYFGQGPWTPFQMAVWGMIGFLAGLIGASLKKNRILLSLYGAFSGVVFSLLMDVWTVLWADGFFHPARYLTAVAAALPYTAAYAVSNVVFLLILTPVVGKALDRLKKKYRI